MAWEGHAQPEIEELERRSLPEVAGAFRLVEAVVAQARADLHKADHRKSAQSFLQDVRQGKTWVAEMIEAAMAMAGWEHAG